MNILSLSYHMEMDIQSAKIELIQWLSTLEDKSTIQQLMELREKGAKDLWQEISDEEKNSIIKGISDADQGKLKPHSEARKVYDWKSK